MSPRGVAPVAIAGDIAEHDRMAALRFLTRAPTGALGGAVRELWLLDDDGGSAAGLPKPFVELVVSLSGVHWWRALPGAREHRYLHGWVTPIQHGPRYARAIGRRRLIGARLQPWAAGALFGRLPAGTGAPPPTLGRLIGGEARRLRRRLIDARDDDDRFIVLGAWLEGRLASFAATASTPSAPSDRASAGALAAALDTSPRTLRRRFARDIGVAPKNWLRLHRFDAVLRDPALGDERRTFADLAHGHGYADQAHFTRDMAALAGARPRDLRRRPAGGPPHFVPLG